VKVDILSRDFSAELATLPLQFTIERYSHSVFGGPKRATIKVTGEENDLWELVERLRCPVVIYSDLGDAPWWGFVADIQLRVGAWDVGVTIDSMFNYIAVAYAYTPEGESQSGERRTTAWGSDADSLAEYGQRELLQSVSASSDEHALAARDMILAQKKYPIPTIKQATASPAAGATLNCRGWYDTLGWRYYANAGTDLVDTATQISAIVGTHGEFITATDLDTVAGLTTSEYRDGDSSALFEIEEMLKMGTSDFLRMLASVDINRRMRVYEEPANDNRYLLTKQGLLYDGETPLRKETCPVGVWARLKDVIPGSVDTSKLADPTVMFIDEAEYEPATDTLRLTPRGLQNVWEIGRPVDG